MLGDGLELVGLLPISLLELPIELLDGFCVPDQAPAAASAAATAAEECITDESYDQFEDVEDGVKY